MKVRLSLDTPAEGPDARPAWSGEERATLERFRELRGGAPDGLDAKGAKAIVRELKAVGGDLRAVRRALTGSERGPALWAVIADVRREESLGRIDAAL